MEGWTKLLLVVVVAATALSASLETVFDNKLGEKRKKSCLAQNMLGCTLFIFCK